MTEPLLRRLHARGEALTVGALPWVAPVYRAMPQVAEVIDFPFAHGGLQFRERRALAKRIEGRFDVAYVLPNSLKSALLPVLAGIPRRIGYLGEVRLGFLTHRLKNPPKGQRPPMVAFYSALSGDADFASDQPRLQIGPDQLQAALAGVAHLLPAAGGFYVFAPGAEFGPAKRWPAAHFARLADQLDAPALLLGSGKEAALCDEITAAARPGHCINLAGKTSLPEALALIAGARAVVSNDSGLMHVAAAFGVPQVAVFGSSSPSHTPPLNARARVVWLKNDPGYQPPLDCAPCFERECPLGHTRCLNDVTPARVLAQLQGVLQAVLHTGVQPAIQASQQPTQPEP
jgi:heptosyltransferase-2